jgi:SAM-dependent methyltransferase
MDDWFAHWFDEDYAILYAHRDQEEARQAVTMALQVAPTLAVGPVLDLGCGSGRHLAELRIVNPEAFGLDLSPHLLEASPEALRPWLRRGDMRHLPLRPGTLAGLMLWFTPFGYFGDGENRQLVRDLAAALRPGGVLLLDFLNAGQVRRSLVEESAFERDGYQVQVRRTIEGHRLLKRMSITRPEAGATRKVLESVRLYEPGEIREMAARAGLEVFAELGDYGGSPFEAARAERWIGLFRKPDDGLEPPVQTEVATIRA